jgi:signal-transduction protein with cAMP-binding, CBS, and nucleotidyltransferase domain
VVDESGVVGILDITKILRDTIHKIETSQDTGKENSRSSLGDALKQVVDLQGANSSQAAALQALLGPLISEALGNDSLPTLRSILSGKQYPIVAPDASILEAGEKMAEDKKATLIVEDGDLVGIFTFRDMMSKVIAKELPVQTTPIKEVMTPHPEFVSPDSTVLEALQTMHDGRFLSLPVCENDGSVVGLLDVMDIINSLDLRSVFGATVDMDDVSDEASRHSGSIAGSTAHHSVRSKKSSTKAVEDARPVSKLRPKKPLISTESDSILTVTQMLSNKRGDASLIINDEGALAGIITDTDITRRVVAKHINPIGAKVGSVMTPNPTCVKMSDSAMDALSTMVKNHFVSAPFI